jgi:hypothetical protein
LAGVSIKGQAALTAEEVLRYLPNIGSVIDPMNLNIGTGKKSRIESSDLIKYMKWALGIAALGSAIFTGITWYQHKQVMDRQAELEAKIRSIEDIEMIAQDYERAKNEYYQVRQFEINTHDDNERVLQFIEDCEKLLPTEAYMSKISFASGNVEFDITSGWHDVTKNEVADTMVEIGHLDYVTNFNIPSIAEEYKTLIVIGIDEEGNYIYLTNEDYEGGEPEVEYDEDGNEIEKLPSDPVEYEYGMALPEGLVDYQLVNLRQVTYSASCHISIPHTSIEELQIEAEEAEAAGEVITEETGDAETTEGGAQ